MLKQLQTIVTNHLTEWTEGSAVSEAIAAINLESLEREELNQRIKPKDPIKTGGWWVRGVNWQNGQPKGNRYGQAKPDRRHVTKDGKPAKYLTASGMEPGPIFLAMPETKLYWKDLYDRAKANFEASGETTPLLWTEGAKKAGSGLTLDLPTICLTGVWNWGKDGQLAREVNNWVQPWFDHYLCFDSDYAYKPSCRKAIARLADQFSKKGCSLKIVEWDTQYKGMDDYIKANGGHSFKELLSTAKLVEQWERQFKKTDNLPPPNIIAKEIAETYQDILAFNEETQSWFRYGAECEGKWTEEPDTYIESIVLSILEGKGIDQLKSFSYVTNTIKFLRCKLNIRNWTEADSTQYLPYQNGVLEVETGKLVEHAPSYLFTWQLPRKHDPLATNWATIDRFLDAATGNNEKLKKFLLCYANAVIKGRSDIQVFLSLVGAGGTGKGTYARLLTALVGETNTYSTSLEDWNNNRFESANAYAKRLLLFPDEDKYKGNLGTLKKATGGDWLRREIKTRQATQFKFGGMAVIASNFPVFGGDKSSGLKRRLRQITFNNLISRDLRASVEKAIDSELAGFTNYILNIPDSEVTDTLLQLNESCPEMLESLWEDRMRTDAIADWLNANVIYDPTAMTPIGCDRDKDRELFGNFYQYTEKTGGRPVASKEFSPRLIDLCRYQLGWVGVEKKRNSKGWHMVGLRLRMPSDSHLPNPIESMYAVKPESVELSPFTVLGSGVGSQPLSDEDCVGCVGSSGSSSQQNLQASLKSDSEPKQRSPKRNPQCLTPTGEVKPVEDKCWRDYPHPSDPQARSEARRNQTLQIRKQLIESKSRSQLQQVKQKFGEKAVLWVYKHCLTDLEYRQVKDYAEIEQQKLDL